MFKNYSGKTFLQKLSFSPLLVNKTTAKKIAYIAVITSVLTVGNTFLEIKFSDVQFSLTLFLSAVAGILLGGLSGFAAAFIADAIGFMISSWGFIYMPWVGLSSATTALVSGLIFYFVKMNFKGGIYIKLALISLLSFILCTVGINTTGFYFYNYYMGFSTAVLDYVSNVFGGDISYFAYLVYRLIFKGQIFNCIFNYALIIAVLPLILKTSVISKDFQSE